MLPHVIAALSIACVVDGASVQFAPAASADNEFSAAQPPAPPSPRTPVAMTIDVSKVCWYPTLACAQLNHTLFECPIHCAKATRVSMWRVFAPLRAFQFVTRDAVAWIFVPLPRHPSRAIYSNTMLGCGTHRTRDTSARCW